MNKWLKVVLVIVLLGLIVLLLLSFGKKPLSEIFSPSTKTVVDNSKDQTRPSKTYETSGVIKQLMKDSLIVEVQILKPDSQGTSAYSTELRIVDLTSQTKYFFAQKNGQTKPAKLPDLKPGIHINITSNEDLSVKSQVVAQTISIFQ